MVRPETSLQGVFLLRLLSAATVHGGGKVRARYSTGDQARRFLAANVAIWLQWSSRQITLVVIGSPREQENDTVGAAIAPG